MVLGWRWTGWRVPRCFPWHPHVENWASWSPSSNGSSCKELATSLPQEALCIHLGLLGSQNGVGYARDLLRGNTREVRHFHGGLVYPGKQCTRNMEKTKHGDTLSNWARMNK